MQAVSDDRVRTRKLAVRLAGSEDDVRAAQALRWSIFYGTMGATGADSAGLDIDPYDSVCDHLLVEDLAEGEPKVVGTYRLLRQSVATRHAGFYSAGEYDLSPLIRHAETEQRELLELGRSCVAEGYRDAGTIQLLWRGIAHYLSRHDIGTLFGCASFAGTDPDAHAEALSFLYHNHLAPPQLRAVAHAGHHVEMARLPIGAYDPRLAIRRLPPLIGGYLRVGATVGDGAFVDRQFNTVDVFVTMPVEAISARYANRFGAAA